MSETERYPEVRIEVQPGEIVVNSAMYRARSDNIVAIHVDLGSKRAEIYGWSDEATIMMGAGDETLHLDETKRRVVTQVTFPDHKGWDVFSASISKYTLSVCFVKESQ